MWSLNAPLIRVGLSQQGITVARLPRLGWGAPEAVEHLACKIGTGSAGSTVAPEVAAGTAGVEPWRAAVDCLAQWLAEHKGQSLRVQVVLSGRWVRWQLLPWRIELSGRAELTAYAALRFRETYGKAVQGWNILPAALAPGHTAPAAGVDRALVEALNAVCKTHGAQLQALTPYFSSAFDAWHRSIKGRAAWFGTVEADTLTLGLLQGGQWAALQTQRLSGDWRAPLTALRAHIAISCGLHDAMPPGAAQLQAAQPQGTLPLYLAGDLPAPLAQPDMPFTWFAPKPLAERNTPGLRLAMGR